MRKYILDIPIDDFSLQEIKEKIIKKERIFQVFINIHKINLFHKDNNLKQILLDKNCIFSVDGKWVEWLAKIKGFYPKQRFGGLEVIDTFFSLAESFNFGLYILGAEKEILEKAISILKKRFTKAKIVGYRDGFFADEREVINEIKQKIPDILFLALPSPKKELLGYRIFKEVNSLRYVAGVGGALDIIAGKTKRAPRWIQNFGLEWFYRCLQEPHRLSKRYFSDGIKFLRLLTHF